MLHIALLTLNLTLHFMDPALSLYVAYIKKGFKVGIVDKYFEKFIRNHMHGLRPHAVKQLYAKMQ